MSAIEGALDSAVEASTPASLVTAESVGAAVSLAVAAVREVAACCFLFHHFGDRDGSLIVASDLRRGDCHQVHPGVPFH